LSLPLRRAGEVVGVMTLEFAANQRIGPQAAQGLAVAADLLAPQLYDRYQNDRWLITKAGLSIRNQLEHVTGPRYMLAKVIIAISLATVIFVTFFKPMYHVSAPLVIAAPDKVQVSSPFEAVIREIGHNATGDPLRPGDKVEKGQVLAVLDTHELNNRLAQAQADLEAARGEKNKALGDTTRIAEAKIAEQKMVGAQAQINLYRQQINESTVVAPFAGVIMKGDLTSHIGQKAQLGEELYEIQQSDKLRLEMTVAERDIHIREVVGGTVGFRASQRHGSGERRSVARRPL